MNSQSEHPDLENAIIAAIRRIVRATDLQSRQLAATCGLTGPQLVTLRAIERHGPLSLSVLARDVSIGQATLTGIVDRLERADFLERERDASDRRRITVRVTERGRDVLRTAPSLLQDRFRQSLTRLADWERSAMLSTLQRVAAMMEVEEVESSSVLVAGTEPAADGARARPEGADEEPASDAGEPPAASSP